MDSQKMMDIIVDIGTPGVTINFMGLIVDN
jgi:hypothetical protein